MSVSFRPKPAEFAAEVKAGLTSLRKKLVHVRRILAAEVYDPPTAEQLAEVERARKDAAAHLQRHNVPSERRAAQDARDDLPVHALETVRPVKGNISHLMANLDRKRVSA